MGGDIGMGSSTIMLPSSVDDTNSGEVLIVSSGEERDGVA